MRHPHNPQSAAAPGGASVSCGRRSASMVKLGIPVVLIAAFVVLTLSFYTSDRNATMAAIASMHRRLDDEAAERTRLQQALRVDLSKVTTSAATSHAMLRQHDMEVARNISRMLQDMATRMDAMSMHNQEALDNLRRAFATSVPASYDDRITSRDDDHASVQRVPSLLKRQQAAGNAMMNRLELLEVAVHRLLVDSGHPPALVQHVESTPFAACNLRCNERGLSVRVPNVTAGCECSCVGGWTGATCHRPPPAEQTMPAFGQSNDVDVRDVTVPDVVIPLEREELPGALQGDSNRDASCRNASVAYFMAHMEEFRSDKGIDQFWNHALALMPPYCSTHEARVMMVDVGCHVGGRLATWYDMLIGDASTHRCGGGGVERRDSMLLLVEPNPLNLVLLRRRIASLAEEMEGPSLQNGSSSLRGSIQLVDAAVAHYTGDGVLQVDLKANRNKKRDGNERGFLRLTRNSTAPMVEGVGNGKADKNSTTTMRSSDRGHAPPTAGTALRFVRTPVHTVTSLVKAAPLWTPQSLRPVTTISVLKVDAEGMDALVLYGAADVLPMTRVVVFECHKLWQERGAAWAAGRGAGGPDREWWKLREVVEYLAKFGFESFMVGMFYWVPLTPPHLWDSTYEDHMGWSNCVAVRPGHPLHGAFSLPPPCQHNSPRP